MQVPGVDLETGRGMDRAEDSLVAEQELGVVEEQELGVVEEQELGVVEEQGLGVEKGCVGELAVELEWAVAPAVASEPS